jgi:hypothetical protein
MIEETLPSILPLRFDPLEFNGTWFRVLDEYKADVLSKADELRRRISETRALGDIVTGDTHNCGVLAPTNPGVSRASKH